MKILLNSADVIGTYMAGAGLRYWELARYLAKDHDVLLLSPNKPEVAGEGFTYQQYVGGAQFKGYDVMLTQILLPKTLRDARHHDVRVILDAYDPFILENLEI